jgi:hypothetical protein
MKGRNAGLAVGVETVMAIVTPAILVVPERETR